MQFLHTKYVSEKKEYFRIVEVFNTDSNTTQSS